jgi:hypothetical protein
LQSGSSTAWLLHATDCEGIKEYQRRVNNIPGRKQTGWTPLDL